MIPYISYLIKYHAKGGISIERFLSIDLSVLSLPTIFLRVALAVGVGGIIGLERDLKNHAAGFRTYILVCLGSTIVMMTNQFILDMYQSGDPARMGAQVISGIGFLGAGTIMVTNNNHVKGLTTAAGLWSAACIGLAIGIGFYEGALAGGGALLLIMTLFQKFKYKFVSKTKVVECTATFHSFEEYRIFVSQYVKKDWNIVSINRLREKETNALIYSMTFDMDTSVEVDMIVHDLARLEGLHSITVQT